MQLEKIMKDYEPTHFGQLIQASGIAFVLYYQQNRPVLLSERGNCFSVVFNSAKYPNKNFKLSAILFFLLRLNPDTFFISVHHYDLLFFFFRLDVWRVNVRGLPVCSRQIKSGKFINIFVDVLNKNKTIYSLRLFVHSIWDNSQLLSKNVQVKYFGLTSKEPGVAILLPLSPKICPAQMNPPGTKIQTSIASGIIRARNPPYHVKVQLLGRDEVFKPS